MVAKAGLGIIGLGAIGIGGVAFAKPEWLGINKEIIWKPLSQDSDFATKSNSDYNSKFGSTYKNYLVGLDEINKDWWEESFNRWTEDFKDGSEVKSKLGKGFKDKINEAFKKDLSSNDGNNRYLNKICHEIYKSNNTDVKSSSDTSSSGDNYKEVDVWKYCSPLGNKPKTIKEAEETTTKYTPSEGGELIGKAEESNLVSVFDNSNDKFWEIRQQEFYGGNLFKETAAQITVESGHSFFSTEKGKKTPIKEICQLAYEKSSAGSSSTTSPTKEEAKKYCSLEKK